MIYYPFELLLLGISQLREVGEEAFDITLQLLELLDAYPVRVFDVLSDVDQKVGEDMVSNEATVVLKEVDVSKTDQFVFEVSFTNFFEFL